MGWKHDIRRAPAVRDRGTEADLQARIFAGNRVWVVGEVHGHLGTLRALMHRLNIAENDRVVLLGDMIDRGPDSAGVSNIFVNTHKSMQSKATMNRWQFNRFRRLTSNSTKSGWQRVEHQLGGHTSLLPREICIELN